MTEIKTDAQNVNSPNKITTSSMKSILWKRE